MRSIAEDLVRSFFQRYNVSCTAVPRESGRRTPDFLLGLAVPVFCEVKEIAPNAADLLEDEKVRAIIEGRNPDRHTGRWIPNRAQQVFKNVSQQLKDAAISGSPTLLVVYDATRYQAYSHDYDIVQGMFGRLQVTVWEDENGDVRHSPTFFGGDRRFTPTKNTSVSAVARLDGGPQIETQSLRVFHNPFAKVNLDPRLFDGLPVFHYLPGSSVP